MADEPTKKFDLPWGTLLPVLAALGGVISQFKPLVSTRPPVPSEKAVGVTAEQDVDARLWQDPIAVAQKQEALLEAEMKTARVSGPNWGRHDIGALATLLSERANHFKKQVLLLAVMLDAGPYGEQGESRLRARHAVLEGLSESGFLPIDGEHIGFVTASWPPLENKSGSPVPVDRGLLLPWEECEAITNPTRTQDTQNIKRIVVVWLPAVNFNPDPLRRFAALIDCVAGDIRDKIDVKLIGPANSTGLQNMVREAQTWALRDETQKALDGVTIISPLATACDPTLLYQPSSPSPSEAPASSTAKSAPPPSEALAPSPAKSVQELLEKSVTMEITGHLRKGLHFVRTVATDDLVLRKVIQELALRRIHVKKRTGEDGARINGDHIVILTEWDTPYGRSLNTTFKAEASGQSVKEIIDRLPYGEKKALEERERRFSGDTVKTLWRIHSYRYLRGIDGQLPGDSGKDNSREQAQKNQSARDTVAVEATEGLNQSDYLRRLARQLKEANARWQQEDNQGIRAIGLLGSDIYDKMMILRALRPQFPSAIFFTNNYDAHFERRDDWDDTHNLIIASPFGNSLPDIYTRQHIAPFRDSNQTAMYVGALVATGRMELSVARDFLCWQPRIFEIGRQGAQDLSLPWYLEGEDLAESNRAWFRDWFFSSTVPWRVGGAALALLAIAAWIGVTIASRSLPGGGTTPQRLRRVLGSTIFWLACGGPVIVLAVAAFAQNGGTNDEPLAFLSGISIWPTEMLRLIVVMLVLHFMIKAGVDLRANQRKLTELYCFKPLPLTPLRWADFGIGLEQWRISRSKTPGPKAAFSAEETWHAYLCRNKFWPRFIRIAILVMLYSAFAFAFLSLFPRSLPPARGEMAFRFDAVVVFLSGMSLLVLSFYVVDAIQLNSNFIRMFAREVTKWGRSVVRSSHRSPPLNEEELSAYHEIFFVAERTQVVAPLVWYPLVAFSLMLVARSSFFDNWAWPVSLVVIFALNAAWPIGSAVLLRRAAEHLRGAALSNLQLLRIRGHAIAEKREMFDELIAEIRGLKKGAFAPLTEQPFVRAIIVPSGGLGLIALAQRFLDVF
jgi:hypothetical protein